MGPRTLEIKLFSHVLYSYNSKTLYYHESSQNQLLTLTRQDKRYKWTNKWMGTTVRINAREQSFGQTWEIVKKPFKNLKECYIHVQAILSINKEFTQSTGNLQCHKLLKLKNKCRFYLPWDKLQFVWPWTSYKQSLHLFLFVVTFFKPLHTLS